MKIVFVSRMPLAGAPWETMKCLRKYSDLDVHWICEQGFYPDGRVFPTDVLYNTNTIGLCEQLIREADVVHIQNDHPFRDDSVFSGKKMLIQFHSVPKRCTYDMYKKYSGQYFTVRQPWLEAEYPDLHTLPNLMDVEEYTPSNEQRKVPVVTFAPSNSWAPSVRGSRAKNLVDGILRTIHSKHDFVINSFTGMPYLQNLEAKRNSDILIDDVVNNTWHKTTLEGCCFGLAVLTSWRSSGWIYSNLNTLPDTIGELIENRSLLESSKLKSREWIVNEWHPRVLVKEYTDVYEKLVRGTLHSTLCYS